MELARVLRVCSLNAERMNDWFSTDARRAAFLREFARDGHVNDVARTAGRLAAMVRAIDPDTLAVQEAPSRREELVLFVREYLADAYDVFLADTGGQQRLALLLKRGAVDAAQPAPAAEIAGLVGEWDADIDGDGSLDRYTFARTPLVVDLLLDGRRLRIVVAHMKSNFINNGRDLWERQETRGGYIRAALTNRRRITSEGMRIRRWLDERLARDPEAAMVVLGDLNDGPGLDYFEELYLAHNVTDVVIGSAFSPELELRHAQHDVPAERRYSVQFEDFVPVRQTRRLLLDHILLSPGLTRGSGVRMLEGSGRVCHAEYDAQVANHGARREDRPSDHRPVAVDLTY
jgi:endonuclease/exonuclease/phosphatase family metal-dependent hydrolase